ncbi:uncharacterized protein LOC144468998 [Augochlora pura]
MYKFAALFALFACALAAPHPEPAPGLLAAAPVALHAAPVVAAPVAVAHTVPVATSYANTYKVSVKSPLVATAPYYAAAAPIAAATVVKTAPFVAAAPAASIYAHAPVVAAGYTL